MNTNWKEYIENSKGTAIMIPDKFRKEAEKIETKRKAFNKMINEVAHQELELNMATQNLWLEMRRHFAENGMEDIWTKEVGYNLDALQEGEFVIALREQRPVVR